MNITYNNYRKYELFTAMGLMLVFPLTFTGIDAVYYVFTTLLIISLYILITGVIMNVIATLSKADTAQRFDGDFKYIDDDKFIGVGIIDRIISNHTMKYFYKLILYLVLASLLVNNIYGVHTFIDYFTFKGYSNIYKDMISDEDTYQLFYCYINVLIIITLIVSRLLIQLKIDKLNCK